MIWLLGIFLAVIQMIIIYGKQTIKLRDNGSFCIVSGEELIAKYLFESIRFLSGNVCEDQAVIPFAIY